MEKIRLIRKEIKVDGEIINSIFDLKSEYVLSVNDVEGKNLKFIYDPLNEHLILYGDCDSIYVHYQEKIK